MPSVRVRENEPFEAALRRFKRTIEKTGLLTELRAREFYEKPTAERKRKKAAAVKRHFNASAASGCRRSCSDPRVHRPYLQRQGRTMRPFSFPPPFILKGLTLHQDDVMTLKSASPGT